MRLRFAFLIVAVAFGPVAVSVSGSTSVLFSGSGTTFPVTDGFRENLEIASLFLVNSPTYRFDGIEETLKLEQKFHPEPGAWEFIFTFETRHAGYGDRTGKILAQVITPHRAHKVVRRAEVVKAVMDDKRDMVTQELYDSTNQLQLTAQISANGVTAPQFQR